MAVTIKDVAKKADVAISAVSYVQTFCTLPAPFSHD